MFKLCMKRYFTSLKYVFSALGVLFLALLIGASVMISVFTDRVNTMVDEIQTTTQDTDLSFDRIKNALINSFKDESNEEKKEIIENGQAQEWVEETLEEAVCGVVENYVDYAASIGASILKGAAGILLSIALFFLIQILGIMLSRGLINYFCRYEIEHRNIFKIFVARLLHNVLIILSVGMVIYCLISTEYVGIVMVVLYPLIYCVLALISSYVTLGGQRPPFTKVVSFRNIGAILASDLVMLLLTGLLAAGIFYISNIVIALYINLALLIVVSVVVGLNADAVAENTKKECIACHSMIEE